MVTNAGRYPANLFYSFLLNYIVLPVNLIVLLGMVSKRRRVAGGILAAIALNLVISLVRGATYNAVCAIPFFFTAY